MSLIIATKNRDMAAWRAAEEFSANFREALLERTQYLLADEIEALFSEVESILEEGAAAHDRALSKMREMTAVASNCSDTASLKKIVHDFQREVFSFFTLNRSAPAYYTLQSDFIEAVAASAVRIASRKTALLSFLERPLALLAVGDGGNSEFSPGGRLELIMVYDESIQPYESELFGAALHDAFIECGLSPDDSVTPLKPEWRMTETYLFSRFSTESTEEAEKPPSALYRILNHRILYGNGDFGKRLKVELAGNIYSRMNFLLMLIARLHAMNSGITLMGGVRLEKTGVGRGRFRLYENAILPLCDSVTALAILKGESAETVPGKIRGLLSNGYLGVDIAERALKAWHNLHEQRISLVAADCELTAYDTQYLDFHGLSEAAQHEFRDSLESVSMLSRQALTICTAWMEKR